MYQPYNQQVMPMPFSPKFEIIKYVGIALLAVVFISWFDLCKYIPPPISLLCKAIGMTKHLDPDQ